MGEMRQNINDIIGSCDQCQRRKTLTISTKETITKPKPTVLFEVIFIFHHIRVIVTNGRVQPSKVFLKPNRVTRHLQLPQITSDLFLSRISLFDIDSAISKYPFRIARSLAFLHSCNGFINQSNRFSLLFKPFYLFTIYTFF